MTDHPEESAVEPYPLPRCMRCAHRHDQRQTCREAARHRGDAGPPHGTEPDPRQSDGPVL